YKEHAQYAKSLGVPVPGKGEFVSVRVAPADAPGQGVIELEERLWRVAQDTDPATEAPRLPKSLSEL
ncbi:MAG: NaeI family type II restriction endonuclease, partial [Pirellulaceae bacterium]